MCLLQLHHTFPLPRIWYTLTIQANESLTFLHLFFYLLMWLQTRRVFYLFVHNLAYSNPICNSFQKTGGSFFEMSCIILMLWLTYITRVQTYCKSKKYSHIRWMKITMRRTFSQGYVRQFIKSAVIFCMFLLCHLPTSKISHVFIYDCCWNKRKKRK